MGLLVTLTSVGAGAIGVTVLLLYPKTPMARIVGSDIAHAVPPTLVAGIGHWFLGSVDWRLLSTVDELVKIVHENESIYIPIGAIHRLENRGSDRELSKALTISSASRTITRGRKTILTERT
jgi:hypothetical protein